MRKPLTIVFQLLAAGMMLLGNALRANSGQRRQLNPLSPPPAQAPAPAKTQSAAAAKKPATAKPVVPLTLKTQKEKASYALGVTIGRDLKRKTIDKSVDPALTAPGIEGFSGRQQTVADRG